MSTEMSHNVEYIEKGNYLVSNELFLDLIFNSRCNCKCKFCIAETPTFAVENFNEWKKNLKKTFEIFDVKDIIILGGEATIDPLFFEKLEYLEMILSKINKKLDNIVLTTNGIMFRNKDFLRRLLFTCITTINLSCMNYDKNKNDTVMMGNTLKKEEILFVYNEVKKSGRTMRLNVNVFKDNCDSIDELESYVDFFNGCCDVIKFSPLMESTMFGTISEVTEFTKEKSLSHDVIKDLYNSFAKRNLIISENDNVFGLLNYKEISRNNQHVILKYAQVEDTYDLDKVIPTLKLYPNGNLSNEWDYKKDILKNF